MARSFYRSLPDAPVKDFYHEPSDTHYSQSVRAGRYYQRRWQIGPDGREINSEELPVDYVMGSGNHARTYLSRKTNGALIELPLAWYSEKGGYWAMNPGYDTPHPPSHRLVAYECMFCHNSYPRIPVISRAGLALSPSMRETCLKESIANAAMVPARNIYSPRAAERRRVKQFALRSSIPHA